MKISQGSAWKTIGIGNNNDDTVLYVPADSDLADYSEGATEVHTPSIQWRPYLTGNGTIDGVIKKFGAGSLKFVRTSSQYVKTDDIVGTTYTSSKRWAFATDPFTIGFWYNFTSHTFDHTPISQVFDINTHWLVYFNCPLDYIAFYHIEAGVVLAYYTCAFHPNNGQWYWFEFARAGVNFYISIDGFMQPLNVGTPIGGNNLSHINKRLTIGRFDLAGFYRYCDGYIDDLFIDKGRALHTADFARPVSAGENNSTQYTVGYWNFDADMLDRGAYNDMIDYNNHTFGAGCARFNKDYYQHYTFPDSDDFFPSDNLSIELDALFYSLPADGEYMVFLGQVGGNFNAYYMYFGILNNSGTYQLDCRAAFGFTGAWSAIGNLNESELNKWYRFCFIRSAYALYLYQNYQLLYSGDQGDDFDISYPMSIGMMRPSTTGTGSWHPFDGEIDELSFSRIDRVPYGKKVSFNEAWLNCDITKVSKGGVWKSVV